jgi:hypothetical protein
MMKKQILMIAGASCLLFASPTKDAQAEVNINVGINARPRTFVIDHRPTFIELAKPGFSMAIGSPYDIVYYGNVYYVNDGGYWYRARDYRGPWVSVRERNLPRKIRRYRIDEIRRYRDIEYRRNRDRYDRYDRYDNRRDERGRPGPDRPDGPPPYAR